MREGEEHMTHQERAKEPQAAHVIQRAQKITEERDDEMRTRVLQLQEQLQLQARTIESLQQRITHAEQQNESLKRQLAKSQSEASELQRNFITQTQEYDDLLNRFNNAELNAVYSLHERTESVNKLTQAEIMSRTRWWRSSA